jgi:predicted PurR-regulated permease PerM
MTISRPERNSRAASANPPEAFAPVVFRLMLSLVAIVGGILLLLRLADVLLMAFGAVLVGVLLHALADLLQRLAKLNRLVALTLSVFIIVLVLGLTVWAFGSQAASQFANLSQLLPRAWANLHQRLGAGSFGGAIVKQLDGWSPPDGWLLGAGSRLATNTAAALGGSVIVIFAGLYLAYHPQSYLQGLLRLVPVRARRRTETVLFAVHDGLKQWLAGQVLSMILVGVTTDAGLALAGAPSPVALGIIAGIGQFVPVIGPMAAAVPGLLAALTIGPETVGWTALVYLVACQAEANLITPLILRQMAELPMAVTLFAVLAMGVLLGPLGVLFATPLAVALYVVVKMVYVEGLMDGPAPASAGDPRDSSETTASP